MTSSPEAVGAGPESAREPDRDETVGSDRAKSFIDAVVAIAMTLLILPLMEAVTGSGGDGSAAHWFGAHGLLLFGFAVSFVVIAMFWAEHHWLFARVHRVTASLLWLNVAWLAMIVWLPVATAMSDQFDSSDPLVVTVYIGSMAAASILLLAQWIFLSAHPRLHDFTEQRLHRGVTTTLAMSVLFVLSLAVAVLVPAIGYLALFLLGLVGPLAGLLGHLWGAWDRRNLHREPEPAGFDESEPPTAPEGAP